jgi:hypothetical protein
VPWEHGTTTGYARKCRCDACKAAHAQAAADYNARNRDKQQARNRRIAQRRLLARRFNARQQARRRRAAAERRRRRVETPDCQDGELPIADL